MPVFSGWEEMNMILLLCCMLFVMYLLWISIFQCVLHWYSLQLMQNLQCHVCIECNAIKGLCIMQWRETSFCWVVSACLTQCSWFFKLIVQHDECEWVWTLIWNNQSAGLASVMSQDRSLHQSSQFWEWFVKQAFTQNVQIRENNKANTSFWSSRASKSVLYSAG